MDIVEILVLTVSIPGMCLLLLILTWVEEWLRDDTKDGWALRPAAARRRLPLPLRTTSHIRHICHDSKHLAKLLVLWTNRPDADLTFKRTLPGTSVMVSNTPAPDPAHRTTEKTSS